MNGIFLTSRDQIIDAMKPFLFRNEIELELGEPLTHFNGNKWLVSVNAFACFDKNKIRYIYVEPNFRGYGIGTELLLLIENEIFKNYSEIKLVCKPGVLPFYKKQFYFVEKAFINWINLKKCKNQI